MMDNIVDGTLSYIPEFDTLDAQEYFDNRRRIPIFELRRMVKRDLPNESEWFYDRFSEMVSRIRGWMRTKTPLALGILVDEAEYVTRSPGKKRAIELFHEYTRQNWELYYGTGNGE